MNTPTISADLSLLLDSFDLTIKFESSCQVLGVFGKSGSGKTTLLEALSGFKKGLIGQLKFGDSIWIDSESKIHKPARNREIGYVPQDYLLFPHWKVVKNLEAGSYRARINEEFSNKTKNEIIEILDLTKLLNRYPSQLSGGEKQRVALARALCSAPKLLLLDEPFASLDLGLRRKILPYLLKIKSTFKIPIIIVSHDPTELLALCDEVIAIDEGRIIAHDTPNKVFTSSAIYDLASSQGYQNILKVYLESSEPLYSIARIATKMDSPTVQLPPINAVKNAEITISIGSSDILIATQPITGLSARNCIPATIRSINTRGKKQLVNALLKNTIAPTISIEVTQEAINDLNLTKESDIWLIFKTNAIQTYY